MDSQNSRITVQKYGGSSVSTTQKIRQVARLVVDRASRGEKICVVVSAMGKTTDQLLGLAKELSENPPRRELDMLLTCGERASMALLAMALEELGCKAVSLTGSQSGIITNDVHSGAKILEVRPQRVLSELNNGKVVIVAGFQGVSVNKEITTLGRGGSDTTAVALAASLGAEACEIYSDVKGVFSADPNIVKDALLLPTISFNEMEELSLFGAKVMHAQAVQFARDAGIKIHALKTDDAQASGTLIGPCEIEKKTSQIALSFKEGVFCFKIQGQMAMESFFSLLVEKQVGHFQCFGSALDTHTYFLVSPEDAHGIDVWAAQVDFAVREKDCCTVSLVGLGLSDTPKAASVALQRLIRNDFLIRGINTAPNRCTFVLDVGEGRRAIGLLHSEFKFSKMNEC